MPIREISFFSYRSYKGRGRTWSSAELGVLRFVRSIKQADDIGDSETLRVNGVLQQIGQGNPEDAFEWFGSLANDVLKAELGTTEVVLVPVPNSDCTRHDTPARTAKLAEAIAEKCDAAVHDLLRWKIKMPSASHGGGNRRPEILYPQLRVLTGFPTLNRPYVLIDDVASTGGHIRACAAVLTRRVKVRVPLAIAGAQTAMEPVVDPYAQLVREHEDFVP
jgi:hypothetical protein